MKRRDNLASDESLAFLNKFVELFEDIIEHEGYGDISINVRRLNSQTRLVLLGSGKEYRFQVRVPREPWRGSGAQPRFRINAKGAGTRGSGTSCPERSTTGDRRRGERRKNRKPRNFRPERRLGVDRRGSTRPKT